MDVCRAYKIPYSEFLAWTQDDRHAAVMHELRTAQRCRGCGTHPDDWDPLKGGAVDAYVADLDECRGCASLEKKRAELDKARERGTVRAGVTARLRAFDPDNDDLGPEAHDG